MRYVLHPGYVTSKVDGQEHFIGGPRLAQLYGVDIRQCVFGDVPEYLEQDGDIHLRPDYHGNYLLPSNAATVGGSPLEAVVTSTCGECALRIGEECDGSGGSREGREVYDSDPACDCFEPITGA